jgi:hypothetical protein
MAFSKGLMNNSESPKSSYPLLTLNQSTKLKGNTSRAKVNNRYKAKQRYSSESNPFLLETISEDQSRMSLLYPKRKKTISITPINSKNPFFVVDEGKKSPLSSTSGTI